MMTQLNMLAVLPWYVLNAIAWASCRAGEVVIVVNPNSQGAGAWLKENLSAIAVTYLAETNQSAIKAAAPSWSEELKQKKWAGSSGSNHPLNNIKW